MSGKLRLERGEKGDVTTTASILDTEDVHVAIWPWLLLGDRYEYGAGLHGLTLVALLAGGTDVCHCALPLAALAPA